MEMSNIDEYLKNIKHGMFASRQTTKEAMDYAYELIETINKKDTIAAFTALHVVLNTVSDEIKRLIS